jgi:hypothetical protein
MWNRGNIQHLENKKLKGSLLSHCPTPSRDKIPQINHHQVLYNLSEKKPTKRTQRIGTSLQKLPQMHKSQHRNMKQ